MRRLVRNAGVVVLLIGLMYVAGCEVMAPADHSPQMSVTVETEAGFREFLRNVDAASLRVTPPGAAVRDTIMRPRKTSVGIFLRAVLRPGENSVGTIIAVTLRGEGAELFRGEAVLDETTATLADLVIDLDPIADLDIGNDWVLVVGDRLRLADFSPIVLPGGERGTSDRVLWTSLDPSVVEVDSSELVMVGVGTTEVVATWSGQADTMSVTVEPFQLLSEESSFTGFLAAEDTLTWSTWITTQSVDRSPQLEVVPPAEPWLSATLSDPTPPSLLTISAVGASMPEGVSAELVVRATDGSATTALTVAPELDPASAEVRVWDRFCAYSIRRDPSFPDHVACIELTAKAWDVGNDKRVVLLARNLSGSLGDAFDTAPTFAVNGFGFFFTAYSSAEVLGARPAGTVGISGSPFWNRREGDAVTLRANGANRTQVYGCTLPAEGDAYRTCAADGETGAIRADFLVAGNVWTLSEATATMDFTLPSVQVSGCPDEPGGSCDSGGSTP